jgi:hypothetical protein
MFANETDAMVGRLRRQDLLREAELQRRVRRLKALCCACPEGCSDCCTGADC